MSMKTTVLLVVVLSFVSGCGPAFTEASSEGQNNAIDAKADSVSLAYPPEAGPSIEATSQDVQSTDAGYVADRQAEATADAEVLREAAAPDVVAADVGVLPDNWVKPLTATYISNQGATIVTVETAGVTNTCNGVQPCCPTLASSVLTGNPYTPAECVTAVVANDTSTCLAVCAVLRKFHYCEFNAQGTSAPDPCGQAYP
jgi:hypothetical protein